MSSVPLTGVKGVAEPESRTLGRGGSGRRPKKKFGLVYSGGGGPPSDRIITLEKLSSIIGSHRRQLTPNSTPEDGSILQNTILLEHKGVCKIC